MGDSLCEIVVDEKRSVIISEHNGMIWFVAKYNGFVNFCKRQSGSDTYQPKASPVSVCLGDVDSAVRVLQSALVRLRSFGTSV